MPDQPQPKPPSLVIAARESGLIDQLVRKVVETPWWKTALAGGALLGGMALAASRIGRRVDVLSVNPGEMLSGVVYEPGETGWVEDLGDGTFRISNVPLAPLNMDDVVTLVEVDGRPTVDRVVRRVFTKKAGIRYHAPYEKNYRKLRRAFDKKGWKLEGGVEGFAQLAHDGSERPERVARGIGVEITVEPLRLR